MSASHRKSERTQEANFHPELRLSLKSGIARCRYGEVGWTVDIPVLGRLYDRTDRGSDAFTAA